MDRINTWEVHPTYWAYQGEPILLLGAFNHGHNPFIDGSTLDTIDIDPIETIITQIDEMVEAGGNVLRCVLDLGGGTSVGIEAYQKNADGHFDLKQPKGEYWDRLSTFISEAERKGVIVELEIWDRFDWQSKNWEYSPFNPKNNINYNLEDTNLKESYERREIYKNHPMALGVPKHPSYESADSLQKRGYDVVREFQEIFVKKIYELTKDNGNVIYNMNNETSENPAWGEYWINFLNGLDQADELVCTNMQDGLYIVEKSDELKHQLNHPELYDYLDISQINSRLRDEEQWHAVSYIAEQASARNMLLHMTKVYGNDDRKPAPWASWRPGDTDNAIEEWWRNLIAGVAGIRFHRPESGIGLNAQAKACIQATRKVESKIKFWKVKPALELLSDRDFDEAYLAADPGKQYIIYFTQQGAGSIKLDLSPYSKTDFSVFWVNIDTGKWGPEAVIKGGSEVPVNRPDGEAHWVAAVVLN
ncbi:MAG: hypothetical protein AAF705_13360 [Bacteroidota bacterium]